MKKMFLGAIVLLTTACATHTEKSDLPLLLTAPSAQELILPPTLETEPIVTEDFSPLLDSMESEETAKLLLEQQAGPKIDTYFYYMNQWYRQQQAAFIFMKRVLLPRRQQDGSYLITCTAKARTGIDKKHLHALNFPCGVWKVEVGLQIVLPHDKKAEDIWAE